jgi:2,3,4,5-tetrahydropyridine-2-carboxylate N-succinyltransferase
MTTANNLEKMIQSAYENRSSLNPHAINPALKQALDEVIDGLEQEYYRAAIYEPQTNQWHTQVWIKQAILLYFLTHHSHPIPAQFTQFYDKVPVRFRDSTAEELHHLNIRIVPPATVRRGVYVAPGAILMPSFSNMGAYIGEGSMVDSWVTVGSCAQIGKQVHLSMGVGIGGVLEPLQAHPTIIEDQCFIGAGSQIVEGVIVETGSVISMGVYIGQSTPIYDRNTKKIYYGRVPAHSVVVPGFLPHAAGEYGLSAAIIVIQVDQKTREKIGINEILRTTRDLF